MVHLPVVVRIVLSTTLIFVASAGADPEEACPTCRSEGGRAADDLALLQHHLSADEGQAWPRRARRKRRPRLQRRGKAYYGHDNGDNLPENPTTTADLPPDVPVPTTTVTVPVTTSTTTVPVTTSTTTAAPMWILGDLHDTCNDLCQYNGYGGCGADEIAELDTPAKVEDQILNSSGKTCTTTPPKSYGAFFDPADDPATGKCFYVSGTVDCDRNDRTYEQPLCFCNGTTVTTTPDAGWLVAELHDTCNDFCRFNGFDGCNESRIQEINRHPRATRLLEGLGYNCSAAVAGRGAGVFFDPPGTAGTAGKCFYTSGTVDCDVNTKTYEQPVCQCSTVTTATTTPDATRWQIGGVGDTCNDVCTHGCDETEMAEINRHPRATRLLEGLGYNCSSTVAGRSYGIFFDPVGTSGTVGKCLYASGTIDCGRNPRSYEQPVCYCNAPPP